MMMSNVGDRALQAARTAKSQAKVIDEASRQMLRQEHAKASSTLLALAHQVALNLCAAGFPNVTEITYYVDERFRQRKIVTGGWILHICNDGGETWVASTYSLLATGEIIFCNGAPLQLNSDETILTPEIVSTLIHKLTLLT